MNKKGDIVADYLKATRGIPLLKRSEEIELGQQVKKMMQCLDIRKKLDSQSRLSEEDWAKKVGVPLNELRQIIKKGEKARDKMIKGNLRLVISIAKKYQFQSPVTSHQSPMNSSSLSYNEEFKPASKQTTNLPQIINHQVTVETD